MFIKIYKGTYLCCFLPLELLHLADKTGDTSETILSFMIYGR